jgi:hypothetical protein
MNSAANLSPLSPSNPASATKESRRVKCFPFCLFAQRPIAKTGCSFLFYTFGTGLDRVWYYINKNIKREVMIVEATRKGK